MNNIFDNIINNIYLTIINKTHINYLSHSNHPNKKDVFIFYIKKFHENDIRCLKNRHKEIKNIYIRKNKYHTCTFMLIKIKNQKEIRKEKLQNILNDV